MRSTRARHESFHVNPPAGAHRLGRRICFGPISREARAASHCRAFKSTRRMRLRSPPPSGLDRRRLRPHPLRASSTSCSASPSRTSASTSRTASATGPTTKKIGHARRGSAAKSPQAHGAGTLPPGIGIRIKTLGEELKRAQPAHVRPVSRRRSSTAAAARCRRTSSSRCRRSRRPSRWPRSSTACDAVRATAAACRWRAALRADGRDARSRSSTPDGAVALPRSSRGQRPGHGRALRHLRLHGVARHHRRAPAHASPGVRLRAST